MESNILAIHATLIVTNIRKKSKFRLILKEMNISLAKLGHEECEICTLK